MKKLISAKADTPMLVKFNMSPYIKRIFGYESNLV